ncbi:hypothetical protein GOZ89_24715 [Agrobacterium vitis]|uniref:restriction endonuclease n=1 Tax=Agrobacterium vitis TaxID=373 RepID=UPI0012E8A871|nr:restriction endonuclease [Agrobacterium vitis]MVA82607.1 hypothetical protein [Agrobacterium vitis]
MIKENVYFEMIVAAMNRDTMPGADVQWNVKIEGRQFDVVISIPSGLYSLMLAVEVKNHARRVEAENIEAFITKGRDAKANKLVFVSANGFQSGCADLAVRHGVDLFELKLTPSNEVTFSGGAWMLQGSLISPPVAEILPEEPGNAFEQVKLIYEDGSEIVVPDESTQMRYYLEHTIAGGRSLLDLISPESVPTLATGAVRTLTFPLGIEVAPPDQFFLRPGLVREMRVEVRGAMNPVISGNVAFETTALSPTATYTNVVTGVSSTARLVDLPFGPPCFEAGKFYFAYHPLRYVYCDSVVASVATIFVIESFQRGVLVRQAFDCDADYSRFYIPIRHGDRKLRGRLEARLQSLRKLMA